MCPVCRVGLAPTVNGRVRHHTPGFRRVLDRNNARCSGGGQRSQGAPSRTAVDDVPPNAGSTS